MAAAVGTKPRKAHKPVPSRRDQEKTTGPAYRILLLGLLLAIATAALYYPVGHHPFVTNFDDDDYVTNNVHIKDGLSWETVRWAFTTFDQANWHPLTWLSHALDCQLFGLNSGDHHDTNLLLHVVNVVLLFWVLWRATGFAGRSLMVAALFALHPINVESVAWVAERKNLLSLFFFLLALGAYRWYAGRPRVGRYVVVAFWYALGLMAKPQVVTFPLVLLLWDYWPLQRMFAGDQDGPSRKNAEAVIPPKPFFWLVLEKLPLLALSAMSAVVTTIAQRLGGGMNPDVALSIRLGNAVVSYLRYVEKAIWPARLAPMYPHPGSSLTTWQIAAASVFLVAATGLVIAGRQRRYLVMGWLWFMGTMVPMIGLVQVGRQAMADRYAYLPLLGLFIVICWSVADWAAQRHVPTAWLAGISVAVLLVLTVVTHRQIGYWGANLALWSHTLEVTSGNYQAEDYLGDALLAQGQPDEALKHFYRAADLEPSFPVTHMYIGRYQQQIGNLPAAIEQYKQVISLTQNAVRENGKLRDTAFANMGYAYRELGDLTQARENLEAAVSLNPRDVPAWIALGLVAQKSNDTELAIRAYLQAMKVQPSDVGYLLLARVLQQDGRNEEAEAAMRRAKLLTRNFDQTQKTADRLLAH